MSMPVPDRPQTALYRLRDTSASLRNPVAYVRSRFSAATLGAITFPLVVLFFVYFFDEFDTAAFGVLAPEIKRAFHLTDKGFVGIIALNLAVVLAASIPIGYYGDRMPRRKLVVAGAVVAGVFSLATGAAPTLLLLALFRIGNGVGVLVNQPIHRSLLTDYYKPEARPTVFAQHSNAPQWGAVAGPLLAGAVAFLATWRAAFLILIVPILYMAYRATKLPPVERGQSDDEESAALAAEERPYNFGRSVRILLSVRTLRWQYASWVAIGAGFLPLAAYVPIYLDKVYHLNPLQIGVLGAAGAIMSLIGIRISGRYTPRWLAKDLGYPLQAAGLSLVAVAPFLLVAAFAPDLPIAVIAILGANFVGAWFYPPFLTIQALVSPARVRSLSYSFGSLFLVAGLIAFDIVFAGIADHNVRNGIASLVPFWVIGGLILRSAHRYVTPDTTRALSVLQTSAEMRRARLTESRHNILAVKGVDVSYGPVQILFGVDLEVAEGEILALLGTNGAGKSTLLKAISGLVPIHGGTIFFDGEDVTGLEPEESFALGLVQVPGGKGIFPGMTVRENLEVAVWATHRPKAEAEQAQREVLELFPSLQRRYDQPAAVLSGGEQQMLTLAQAFISKPKLLMIDELSLGLAPVVVEELLQVVRRMHDEGTSIILVEQSVNVALTVADRAVFMEKGEVRFTGPTDELLGRDDILRAVFLNGTATLEGASR